MMEVMTGEAGLQRVGDAVEERRGQLGMTQQDLADAAGVDLKTVYNMESGLRWPRVKNRTAIAAALGWPTSALHDIRNGADPAALVREQPRAKHEDAGFEMILSNDGLTDAEKLRAIAAVVALRRELRQEAEALDGREGARGSAR